MGRAFATTATTSWRSAFFVGGTRPFSVVLAFCGVDGSLVDVIKPRATEDWVDIEAVLGPLLHEIKEVRLGSGCSLSESMPVFHSTDVHLKHRKQIRRLYRRAWPELRLRSSAPAPKARARRVRVRKRGHVSKLLTVTGDPLHDRLALRRALPVSANDSSDLGFDHDDLIARLSTPDRPPGAARVQLTPETSVPLGPQGRELLLKGVQCATGPFQHLLASN